MPPPISTAEEVPPPMLPALPPSRPEAGGSASRSHGATSALGTHKSVKRLFSEVRVLVAGGNAFASEKSAHAPVQGTTRANNTSVRAGSSSELPEERPENASSPVSGAGSRKALTKIEPAPPVEPRPTSSSFGHTNTTRQRKLSQTAEAFFASLPATRATSIAEPSNGPTSSTTAPPVPVARSGSLTWQGFQQQSFSSARQNSRTATPMYLCEMVSGVLGSFETGSQAGSMGSRGKTRGSGIDVESNNMRTTPRHSGTKQPALKSVVRAVQAFAVHRHQSTTEASGGGLPEGSPNSTLMTSSSIDGSNNTTDSTTIETVTSSDTFSAKRSGSVMSQTALHSTAASFADDTSGETTALQNAMIGMTALVHMALIRFQEFFDASEGRPVSFHPGRSAVASQRGGRQKLLSSVEGSVSPVENVSGAAPPKVSPKAGDSAAACSGAAAGFGHRSASVPPSRTGRHHRGGQLSEETVLAYRDVDDCGRGEESMRRYKDWTTLCRHAFPGAAGLRAFLRKDSVDLYPDTERRLLQRTSKWLEANVVAELMAMALSSDDDASCEVSAVTPSPAQTLLPPCSALEQRGGGAVRKCPREVNVLFTAWQHRRSGALYQRALHATAMALRRLMLPGTLFVVPMNTTYALGGELVTATWLPPLTSAFPVHLTPRSFLSETSRQVTSLLLGSFFANNAPVHDDRFSTAPGSTPQHLDEDHVAAVDFYACADGTYCLIPNANLLDALTMGRTEMTLYAEVSDKMMAAASEKTGSAFASRPGQSVLGGRSAEELHVLRVVDILLRAAPMLFAAGRVEGGGEHVTMLRDVFHSNGLQMRDLLKVREVVDRQIRSSAAISRDALPSVQALSQFMLSEAVARTLKAMALYRASSSSARTFPADGSETCSLPPHIPSVSDLVDAANKSSLGVATSEKECGDATRPPQTPPHMCAVVDAVNLVFKKFTSSPKFQRESLAPALTRRFCTVSEFQFDPKQLLLLDVVAFLKHRLGLQFQRDAKQFALGPPFQASQEASKTTTSFAAVARGVVGGAVRMKRLFASNGVSDATPTAMEEPSRSASVVKMSVEAEPDTPAAISLLSRSSFAPLVSPTGIAHHAIATEGSGTYLQYLSMLCSDVEHRAKTQRHDRRSSSELPTSSFVFCSMLTPADAAVVQSLHSLVFPGIVAASTLITAPVLSHPTVPHIPVASGAGKQNTQKQDSGASAVSDAARRAGIGPSVVRLFTRLMRHMQLPVFVQASLECSIGRVALSRDTRSTSAASALVSRIATPCTEELPFLTSTSIAHVLPTVPEGFQSTPCDTPLPSVLQRQRVEGAQSGVVVGDSSKREPVIYFQSKELQRCAELAASKMWSALDEDHKLGAAAASDASVAPVAMCDGLMLATLGEVSSLMKDAVASELVSTVDAFALPVAGDSSEPLAVWAMAVSLMGPVVFQPYLLHHASRALLMARVLHKDFFTELLAVLQQRELAALHGGGASPQGHVDARRGQAVLSAACNAVGIGSTTAAGTLIDSAVSFLLSLGFGVNTERFGGSQRIVSSSRSLDNSGKDDTMHLNNTQQPLAALGVAAYCSMPLTPFGFRCLFLLARRALLRRHSGSAIPSAPANTATRSPTTGDGVVRLTLITAGPQSSITDRIPTPMSATPFGDGLQCHGQQPGASSSLPAGSSAMSVMLAALVAPSLLDAAGSFSLDPLHSFYVRSSVSTATSSSNTKKHGSMDLTARRRAQLHNAWSAAVYLMQSSCLERQRSHSFATTSVDLPSASSFKGLTPGAAAPPLPAPPLSPTGSIGSSTSSGRASCSDGLFGSVLSPSMISNRHVAAFAHAALLTEDVCLELMTRSSALREYLEQLRLLLVSEGYAPASPSRGASQLPSHRDSGQPIAAALPTSTEGFGAQDPSGHLHLASGCSPQSISPMSAQSDEAGASFTLELGSTPEFMRHLCAQLDRFLPPRPFAHDAASGHVAVAHRRISLGMSLEDAMSFPTPEQGVSFDIPESNVSGAGGICDTENNSPQRTTNAGSSAIDGSAGSRAASFATGVGSAQVVISTTPPDVKDLSSPSTPQHISHVMHQNPLTTSVCTESPALRQDGTAEYTSSFHVEAAFLTLSSCVAASTVISSVAMSEIPEHLKVSADTAPPPKDDIDKNVECDADGRLPPVSVDSSPHAAVTPSMFRKGSHIRSMLDEAMSPSLRSDGSITGDDATSPTASMLQKRLVVCAQEDIDRDILLDEESDARLTLSEQLLAGPQALLHREASSVASLLLGSHGTAAAHVVENQGAQVPSRKTEGEPERYPNVLATSSTSRRETSKEEHDEDEEEYGTGDGASSEERDDETVGVWAQCVVGAMCMREAYLRGCIADEETFTWKRTFCKSTQQ